MNVNRLIKDQGADRLFTIVNYLFASFVFLAVAYPLLYVLSASFSSPEALISGRIWLWPVDFSLEGYRAVFNHDMVWTGYVNSLFYMIAGTLINVTLTIAAAYPLSRKDFPGGKFLILLFAFTLIFSGGMIPTYLLVKDLGMLDSRLALLIPGAINVFNVFVMMTFFRTTIPDEMLDSAKMDGCGNFRFLVVIVIPLSGAVIAVITLFYAVEHWNSFFEALLYLSSKDKYPLQIVLREILLLNTGDELLVHVADESQRLYLNELLKYSLIIVASLPLLVLYPFVQRFFVKGVMIGSLKG